MPQIGFVAAGYLEPAQATELAQVVELEARWENLRSSPAQQQDGALSIQNLNTKQRAYEAFRTKLASYNKRFAPPHVPEMLLNTSIRLGAWCRAMRRLYLQLEQNPQARCPLHLMEKAYRWADLVATKEHKGRVGRAAPATSIEGVSRDLEALIQWCDTPAVSAPAA